jgi:hypothetical protein
VNPVAGSQAPTAWTWNPWKPGGSRRARGGEPLLFGSWAEELVRLRGQGAVAATDPLPLPHHHQVLQGIAQQGREAYAERHDMMFGFNPARQ